MKALFRLYWNSRGVGSIEFALILPVLVLFIYGIYVVGQLFEANAGMQHALGEGARYATLYPTPSDTAIRSKILSSTFWTRSGTFTAPTPTSGTGYKDLTVTYSVPTDFIFFEGPRVTITKTKRVYLAS